MGVEFSQADLIYAVFLNIISNLLNQHRVPLPEPLVKEQRVRDHIVLFLPRTLFETFDVHFEPLKHPVNFDQMNFLHISDLSWFQTLL